MKVTTIESQNLIINEGKHSDHGVLSSEMKKTTNSDINFFNIKIDRIELLEDDSPLDHIKKNHAADTIKKFFRKVIAAQSLGHMLANGQDFKDLGIHYNPAENETKFRLRVLDHFNKVSQDHLNKIIKKINKLSINERALVTKIINIEWHFRHQSNADLRDATLNISSNKRMAEHDIKSHTNTDFKDRIFLSNNDFVFFGVEFSNLKAILPLNRKHSGFDHGANAFILHEKNSLIKQGYLTLTDHLINQVPDASKHEHQDLVDRFPIASKEISRSVLGERGESDVPMFGVKHMKLAMALHLIDYLRSSQDAKFKSFVLDENLTSKNLDRVLNFAFQAEFHIPRIVSTVDFKKVSLRTMELKEAVKALNIHELDKITKNKYFVCEAIYFAITFQNKVATTRLDAIIFHLLKKWEITSADFKKNSKFSNLEFHLSHRPADFDISILKLFLIRGIVNPNTIFPELRKGDTMLDNAIKRGHKEMISLLKANGAKTGEEIRAKF